MLFRACRSSILFLAGIALVLETGICQEKKLPVVRKVISRESQIDIQNWQVSIHKERFWRTVRSGQTVEDTLDLKFDGVSVHKTRFFKFQIPKNHKAYLNFGAVATHATVWVDGKKVGEHLGGWTPFRMDITKVVKESKERQIEIKVQCDEKVGHNTQGFLPVFLPHFGGIWKQAYLSVVPNLHIDKSQAVVRGGEEFDLHIPLVGWDRSKVADLMIEVPIPEGIVKKEYLADFEKKFGKQLGIRPFWDSRNKRIAYYLRLAEGKGSPFFAKVENGIVKLKWRNIDPQTWTLNKPSMNEIRVAVIDLSDSRRATISNWITQTTHRTFEVKKKQFLLNGNPIQIRGLLNWGYAPPRVGPTVDPKAMRREIQFAKDRGFNLMKFCLWIPPKEYLELCDEMGMLAWIEYPTWHPKFTKEKLAELKTEYKEFFYYVRTHPSVVLHSLTCETGPSADLKVIKELYDLCKQEIPGAVVEDDSSWIGWNRIHDFYDDHPYGNNHTWVKTLARLKKHISEKKEKPLILGEAIAADTWFDPRSILQTHKEKIPHWAPGFLQSNLDWSKKYLVYDNTEYGEEFSRNMARFKAESFRYAHRMRKYQIETYRREVPNGGYVVSVIRDIPLCGMGLIDFEGKPKTTREQWNWHRDQMLLLTTENDRKSFSAE